MPARSLQLEISSDSSSSFARTGALKKLDSPDGEFHGEPEELLNHKSHASDCRPVGTFDGGGNAAFVKGQRVPAFFQTACRDVNVISVLSL